MLTATPTCMHTRSDISAYPPVNPPTHPSTHKPYPCNHTDQTFVHPPPKRSHLPWLFFIPVLQTILHAQAPFPRLPLSCLLVARAQPPVCTFTCTHPNTRGHDNTGLCLRESLRTNDATCPSLPLSAYPSSGSQRNPPLFFKP